MDPLVAFKEYETAALEAISSARTAAELEAARIEFLGKKKGRLKDLQALLGKADKEQRPILGKQFNEVRERVTAELESRDKALSRPATSLSAIDITLPGMPIALGRRHPLTQTMDEFKNIIGRFPMSQESPQLHLTGATRGALCQCF